MTELRNVDREIGRFRGRLLAAAAFVIVAFSLLAARLVHLQVVRHAELATQAEANRIAVVPIVPNRGLIVDRNGVVLATNYSAYTLEITPSRVGPDLEPLIDQLAGVVEIGARDRRRFKRLLEESKSFESLPIRTKLTDEEVARFMAQRFRFPGVDVKARLFRNYPLGEVGSHLLGYIGRINQAEKKAMEDWPDEDLGNYKGTEYIGKLGLEQSYERELHGTTGVEQVETSAGGRAVRRLSSHPPTPGNTLVLSIDIKLQALVEEMYGDRRGALVALDPRSGEVLAFVSKPTFDPNLFVDGIDADSWRELNESLDKPLLNRALRGTYPPGSTYKPYMALTALQTGKRTPQQAISDPGYYWFGNHKFRDDKEGGHGTVDMYRSIVQSCDTYYYMLAGDLGVDTIAAHMRPFGFGEQTGIDIEGESRGILPSTDWKRHAYRKPEQQRWYAGETISLGIGQGYNTFTVLQMAQAMATLARGGERHKPHLVREIVDIVGQQRHPVAVEPLPPVPIKPEHLAVIRNALVGVNKEGTSAAAFRETGYVAAGKTGTAQVVGIKQDQKYKASELAEHLLDHALYISYAPADDPQIAVALVVENAGFGAQNAAPIARRVFDYLLLGQYPSEEDMAAVRVGKAATPAGKPRRAADIPLPRAGGGIAVGRAVRDAAMSAVFERPSVWRRLRPVFVGFDGPLALATVLLATIGLLSMYSAGYDHGTRFADHGRNMLIAFAVLFVAAQVPPQKLQQLAVPLYLIGVVLLVVTALPGIGITKKGATRWLNVGVVVQPSEIMKIAMPLMLAWWFQKREGQLRPFDFLVAGVLLVVPVGLVVKQPDLGTALLILAAGVYVIFFAGLSWKLVVPALVLGAAAVVAIVVAEPTICQEGVKWPLLREYQQHRICTLLDPTRDPLGKGFHIIQGMIAIGSGGISGKGFMQGTQTHLEFIPERTTDFIFAAFCEEFGLAGVVVLLLAFVFLIFRGLMIAAEAPTVFTRLLAGAVSLSFFTYAFVNMGMVSGILPVVGVPLPFVSYGGTAMATLGLGIGILMSVARSRRLIQS